MKWRNTLTAITFATSMSVISDVRADPENKSALGQVTAEDAGKSAVGSSLLPSCKDLGRAEPICANLAGQVTGAGTLGAAYKGNKTLARINKGLTSPARIKEVLNENLGNDLSNEQINKLAKRIPELSKKSWIKHAPKGLAGIGLAVLALPWLGLDEPTQGVVTSSAFEPKTHPLKPIEMPSVVGD